MLYALVTLVACLGATTAREANNPYKTMPTISNSLVNLGKMGISFYFNSKVPDQQSAMGASASNSFSKPELEPCPCMAMRNFRNFPNPADILHKLMSNEPPTSTACCDSHEQLQENTVYFEIGPKQAHTDLSSGANSNPIQNALPILPLIFDSLIPSNKQPNLPTMPIKQKAIEIFFFPKKNENPAQELNNKLFPKIRNDVVKKSDIQIVGDKELRNDFKTYKFRPVPPMSSIKKDLAAVEKTETAATTTDVSNAKEIPTTIYSSGNTNTI